MRIQGGGTSQGTMSKCTLQLPLSSIRSILIGYITSLALTDGQAMPATPTADIIWY